MEPECENPLKAIRERHCKNAVESIKQVEAIWAVRNQTPPKEVIDSLKAKYPFANVDGGGHEMAGAIRFVGAHKDLLIEEIKNILRSKTATFSIAE